MKKNSFFFIFCVIFLSVFFNSKVFSYENEGILSCKKLESLLTDYGYTPEKLPVISSDSDSYPYNILIDINNLQDKDSVKHLYFVFDMNKAIENFTFIAEIMNSFSVTIFDSQIHFLFSYGNQIDSFMESTITGTQSFINSIVNEDNSAAVCVGFTNTFNSIVSGSNARTSPSWLISLVADSFFENRLFYLIQGGFINAFYRLNLLKNDYNTGLFLENNIPAIGLNLSDISGTNPEYSSRICRFFDCISTNFDSMTAFEWDNHAQLFQLGNKTYIISEKITLIITLLTAAISLFIICELSFLVKKSGKNISRLVIKTWPLIPASLAATTIAFLIGQMFALFLHKYLKMDYFLAFSIKVFIGFGLISFSYLALIKFNKIYAAHVFSYLLSIMSILNILIFTSLDLSFFYFFALEYLLIYVSITMKRTFSLLIIFICLSLPYIPIFFQLIFYLSPEKIDDLIFCTPQKNILISCAFLPFEFLWFRILIRLNKIWKQVEKKRRNFIKQNIIAISIAVAIFAVISILITVFIPSKYRISQKNIDENIFETRNDDLIKITSHDENYFGNIVRYVNIKLAKQARNIQIAVNGTTSNSVLYSDFTYSSNFITHTDYFSMPVMPPENIQLHYIISNSQDSSITVKVRFLDEPSGLTVKKTLELKQRSREAL